MTGPGEGPDLPKGGHDPRRPPVYGLRPRQDPPPARALVQPGAARAARPARPAPGAVDRGQVRPGAGISGPGSGRAFDAGPGWTIGAPAFPDPALSDPEFADDDQLFAHSPSPYASVSARRPHPVSRRRRYLGRTLIGVGILLVLFVVWVGWRTFQAYRALSDAAGQVTALQSAVNGVGDFDVPAARASVALLQDSSSAAVSATSDPFYRIAEVLPWVGANLSAVDQIAQTVDGLARTTAPALLDAATTVTPAAMVPQHGTIPVAPLIAASAGLERANSQVSGALDRMTGLDRSSLVAPVAKAADDLRDKLQVLHGTTDSAARVARLAPPMLGAQGRRTYLVVFQNLAEPRATGGIFGSYALLDVDKGAITVSGQGASSRTITPFSPPLAQPANISTKLYGTQPGTYPTDVNLAPDFPSSAALFAQMFTKRLGTAVDGVLAVDPVALGYLLQGADPIDIGEGQQLTSTTITRVLLSTVYKLFPAPADSGARDAYVAAATSKAFATVTSSPNDPAAELRGLTRAAKERRILLWSARPAEQQDLANTEISGRLGDDRPAPTVGVFRNDATGGKLGYYATGSASLTVGSCQGTSRLMTLRVPMASTAPSSGLSEYVLGLAKAGDYVLRTNVVLVAPLGGTVGAVRVAGAPVPVARGTQDGRAVAMVTVELPPGASSEVTAAITAPAPIGASVTPELVLTPGIETWKTRTDALRPCS